jgi:hypothetical protein
MIRRHVHLKPAHFARRHAPALLALLGLTILAPASRAQLATLGPVTIGAGLQTKSW